MAEKQFLAKSGRRLRILRDKKFIKITCCTISEINVFYAEIQDDDQ